MNIIFKKLITRNLWFKCDLIMGLWVHFEFLYHLNSQVLWISYLISLSLNFFICRMGTTTQLKLLGEFSELMSEKKRRDM